MDEDWVLDARISYDTVAANYADLVRDSLADEPQLRAALAVFAEQVAQGGGGPVADIGCGPGQVSGYLARLGCAVFGVDLSPEMVAIARREQPGLRFVVGSMTNLEIADASLAGLLAFWSLIHVPDDAVPSVFEGFRRVLRPGAPLLVGFHVGDGSRLKTEGYGGLPMKVYVHRRQPEKVAGWLADAGFTLRAQWLVGMDEASAGALIFARC